MTKFDQKDCSSGRGSPEANGDEIPAGSSDRKTPQRAPNEPDPGGNLLKCTPSIINDSGRRGERNEDGSPGIQPQSAINPTPSDSNEIQHTKTDRLFIFLKDRWYTIPIVLLILSLPFLSSLLDVMLKFREVNKVTSPPVSPEVETNETRTQRDDIEVAAIIRQAKGLEITPDDIVHIDWFELDPEYGRSGLLVEYKADGLRTLHSLFVIREGHATRLFHTANNAESLSRVTVGDKGFLLYEKQEGSGGWLNYSLYSWNSGEKLVPVFVADDDLYHGHLSNSGSRLFVEGAGQVKELVWDNDELSLIEYDSKLRYPELGPAVHVVRVELEANRLVIISDEERVQFTRAGNGIFQNATDLFISRHDSLVVDIDLPTPRHIRVLSQRDNAHAAWDGRLYDLYTPSSDPVMKISIVDDDTDGAWYNLNFEIDQF